jgi:imidazolonepropionase
MTQNLLLMVTFGCCSLGLTIGEALRAVTRGGALALRRTDLGTLTPGARGDVALFEVPDYRHLAYHYGMGHCAATIKSGEVIWRQNETGSRFPT